MAIKGIDVSEHNGNVNYEKVKKAGVEYVIIRAGYGRYKDQKDTKFDRNYSECKRLGIPCGVYWYSYAINETQARQEAKTCLEVIKGKQFEYPIYFDLEEKKQFALGKNVCSSLVKAFCSEMEKAGYFAGLYCSTYWLTNYINDDVKKSYTLWVAEYDSSCHYKGAGVVDMWQKSSTYTISGNSGKFDLDDCYRDFPTVIKKGGYNGYPKQGVIVAGDYDGDGKVTDTDAMKALEASAGLRKPTAAETKRADVNNDGAVTAADAREILKKARGSK